MKSKDDIPPSPNELRNLTTEGPEKNNILEMKNKKEFQKNNYKYVQEL